MIEHGRVKPRHVSGHLQRPTLTPDHCVVTETIGDGRHGRWGARCGGGHVQSFKDFCNFFVTQLCKGKGALLKLLKVIKSYAESLKTYLASRRCHCISDAAPRSYGPGYNEGAQRRATGTVGAVSRPQEGHSPFWVKPLENKVRLNFNDKHCIEWVSESFFF